MLSVQLVLSMAEGGLEESEVVTVLVTQLQLFVIGGADAHPVREDS